MATTILYSMIMLNIERALYSFTTCSTSRQRCPTSWIFTFVGLFSFLCNKRFDFTEQSVSSYGKRLRYIRIGYNLELLFVTLLVDGVTRLLLTESLAHLLDLPIFWFIFIYWSRDVVVGGGTTVNKKTKQIVIFITMVFVIVLCFTKKASTKLLQQNEQKLMLWTVYGPRSEDLHKIMY